MAYEKGTRVGWYGRRATVVYVRFQNDGLTPAAYSIVLDDQQYRLDYAGTIVAAHEVRPLHFCCAPNCIGFTFKASERAHPCAGQR